MKSLPQSIKTTKYNTAKYENRKVKYRKMKSLLKSIKTTKYDTAKYENPEVWKSQSEIPQSEITAKYKNRKVKYRKMN